MNAIESPTIRVKKCSDMLAISPEAIYLALLVLLLMRCVMLVLPILYISVISSLII